MGTSSGPPGQTPTPDSLIIAARTTSRPLSDRELATVVAHVARAGYDPSARERARGVLAAIVWRGRVLRGSDRLPPSEAHYLRHVVVGQEWPPGTTLAGYLDSLRDVALDRDSGILVSRYEGAWQLTIVRRAGALRGPAGFEWVLLDYRVETGHWVTGFQPERGLLELQSPRRSDTRWLRPPT